jgi:hypothetical protein
VGRDCPCGSVFCTTVVQSRCFRQWHTLLIVRRKCVCYYSCCIGEYDFQNNQLVAPTHLCCCVPTLLCHSYHHGTTDCQVVISDRRMKNTRQTMQ